MRTAIAAALICIATPALAFDLQGHRGARGLAPENTLPAFAVALTLGVSTLELDINLTADGAVLVGHDPVLQPTVVRGPDGQFLAGPGPVIAKTALGELKRYDVGRLNPAHRYAANFREQKPVDGTRMPELMEVFALARKAGNNTVRFNIETKLVPTKPDESPAPERIAETLVAEIRREGLAGRVTFQSFDWRTLRHAGRIAPEIPRVMLTIESPNFDNLERGRPGASPWLGGLDIDDHGGSAPRAVKAAGGTVWSPFWRNVTAEALADAKAAGIAVIPWTVNEPAEMARLIDLGVDGLITDYPDRLRAVMAQKGKPLPAPTPVQP